MLAKTAKKLNCLPLLAFAVISLNIVFSGPAIATVYVYVKPDGSKMITDRKVNKTGYSLKRSYSTTPYRSSNGKSEPYHAKPIKSQYDELIVNTSQKYDLEPAFIKAIIHVESAFDRFALSHAGAMGLMQLMPGTSAEYQLRSDHFNAKRNVDVGAQHLRDLIERYDGNKQLSLAAYNAGAGAVSKYNGIPPYKETENYVKKVMKLYQQYKNKL